MKNLFSKGRIAIFWAIGNVLLIAKYFFDKWSIRCEPCSDLGDCPPCETEFMSNILIYLALFNIGMSLVWIITKRINRKTSG